MCILVSKSDTCIQVDTGIQVGSGLDTAGIPLIYVSEYIIFYLWQGLAVQTLQ